MFRIRQGGLLTGKYRQRSRQAPVLPLPVVARSTLADELLIYDICLVYLLGTLGCHGLRRVLCVNVLERLT